jgi:hypothetical protein
MRPLWPIAMLLCAALCSGCASPWEKNFIAENWAGETAPAPLAPLPPAQPVELRSVPWDRVQATLHELDQAAAQSDISPADWPPERKREAKARLLRGLQVSEDPAAVQVIGRSSFRSTNLLRPEAGDAQALESQARRVGATRVVWSRSVLGKTETIVDEPVTTVTNGTGRWWGRGRNRTFSETSTTWVPVTVQADEYGYTAFFLR